MGMSVIVSGRFADGPSGVEASVRIGSKQLG